MHARVFAFYDEASERIDKQKVTTNKSRKSSTRALLYTDTRQSAGEEFPWLFTFRLTPENVSVGVRNVLYVCQQCVQ